MILPVILAGGSGERLWPLSRTAYPKQFLNLFASSHSLFQNTIHRLPDNAKFLPPLIVCHADYRFIVAQQMQAIDRNYSAIILEPIGKNTAPAITLAALWAEKHLPNATLLVLPADHFISEQDVLQDTILNAEQSADTALVTFGINITSPETGFGYIKADNQSHKILEFIEKPDLERATAFYKSTNYYWNSGMFLFTPKIFLQELNLYHSNILQTCATALQQSTQDLDFLRIDVDTYNSCEAISIDYAIMEKTALAKVFPLPCAWSDIGSWQAVWEHTPKDSNGNSVNGSVVTHNTKNCLLDARNRLIATSNVADLIIIETADAILVAHKDHSQDIRKVVSQLKEQTNNAVYEHRKVMRPWGWYDCLANGPGFQVKQIFVMPGKSLSLQSHKYRSEHWIVVNGTAKVIRDSETIFLEENQSTFIPQGAKHQLINYGTMPLQVIEVQSGSYLGEDDIVRYADEHGRAVQIENV